MWVLTLGEYRVRLYSHLLHENVPIADKGNMSNVNGCTVTTAFCLVTNYLSVYLLSLTPSSFT